MRPARGQKQIKLKFPKIPNNQIKRAASWAPSETNQILTKRRRKKMNQTQIARSRSKQRLSSHFPDSHSAPRTAAPDRRRGAATAPPPTPHNPSTSAHASKELRDARRGREKQRTVADPGRGLQGRRGARSSPVAAGARGEVGRQGGRASERKASVCGVKPTANAEEREREVGGGR